ncbi:MAG: dTMP kinase [Clostridiales bacterium]|nr:dTMP kinase [Clostridiales bacterium]
MPLKFRQVIFDLDGTITRSAPGICASAAYAIDNMGFPPLPEDKLTEFVGPPLMHSFMRLCGMTEAQAAEATRLFRERHSVIGWKEAAVYPGIYELVYSLKREGAIITLASSKSRGLCVKTLEYFGLLPFFDGVSAPDEHNAHTVTKQELILAALKVAKADACMVGDRVFDLEGARQAGVCSVAAAYGYGSAEELASCGPDATAADPAALRELLLGDAERMPGFFITLEGSDGCGKTTQSRLLKQYLETLGLDVVLTREPGGCPISEKIRGLLLDVSSLGMTDECEALLFAAARQQHIHDTILPALARGAVVLCDRFNDSSIAYQGFGRGLGDWVRQINARALEKCTPDLTVVFDISPDEALRRRLGEQAADRIELSREALQRRVYEAFISLCESGEKRYKRLDAGGTPEQIFDNLRQTVIKLFTSPPGEVE